MVSVRITTFLSFLICVQWVQSKAMRDQMRADQDCRNGNGDDYSGSMNRTDSGLTCQNWASQSPHNHDFGTHFGDHNYCRNPDGKTSVWCYTTDPDKEWEYCDIPVCAGSDRCPTEDGGECVFPFDYNYDYDEDTGEPVIHTFNGCTNYEDLDKKLWCVKKDAEDGETSFCSKKCPVDVDLKCHSTNFESALMDQSHACDADQEKYCKISKKNSMCQYCGLNTTNCGKAVCSFGITNNTEIKEIVDRHNEVRRKVAKGQETRGKFGGQPQAANMNELVWDAEVARMAQTWANQCVHPHKHPHDKNRNMAVGWQGYCGQNAYWRGHHPYYGHQEKKFLTEAVDAWYNEVKGFDRAAVSSFGKGDHDGEVNHYTQVVWADVTKIGCGYVQRWDGKYFSETIKCNYCTGGNWKNDPIYKIGEPGSDCPDGRKKDDGLCVQKPPKKHE